MIKTLPFLYFFSAQSTIPNINALKDFDFSGFFQIFEDYFDKYVVIPFNASKVGIALGGLLGDCPSYVRIFICVGLVMALSGILIRIIIDLL